MNLAEEMAKLAEPPSNSKPPLWDYWRHDLWSRARNEPARRFMLWPAVYHTMLQDHWPDVVQKEGAQLPAELADKLWAYAEQDATQGSSFRNLVHQAYHLWRWEQVTGWQVRQLRTIHEFGGGYGAMALAAAAFGFEGKYTIYDLPEFDLLQRWYLNEHSLPYAGAGPEVQPADCDLLIACYSLSEVDFERRDQVFKTLYPNSFLLLYSNRFEGYDNLAYFQDINRLAHDMGHSFNWRHERIEHMPPESWYTWGW